MKSIIVTLTLLSTLQLASAAERLPREEALKFAFILALDLKQLQGAPIPTDVDLKHPVALREGEYGALLLPEAKLTRDTLAKAGKETVPIGQLWTHKLTPIQDGQAVPAEKLRLVTIRHEGEEATVPQFTLGARRASEGELELLVLGKNKEPLLKVPLKKIEAAQDEPIDMSAERTSDVTGHLTLKILGQYEAHLTITELSL